eukprot:2659436-Amphidinium_carterae.1
MEWQSLQQQVKKCMSAEYAGKYEQHIHTALVKQQDTRAAQHIAQVIDAVESMTGAQSADALQQR